MIQPLTDQDKTLAILRGEWPVTYENFPWDEYVAICEGAENTAELLRQYLMCSETERDFCQQWVTHMSGFDSDLPEVEQQRANYEWAQELYQTVQIGLRILNHPESPGHLPK